MINILINLAPLKAGGGQNVGLNLLAGLEMIEDKNIALFYYVSSGSLIGEKVKKQFPEKTIEGPHNTVKRVLFERIELGKYLKKKKIDVIYSCFGYAFVSRKYKQVCGMAESNIMFPEIDFWKEYTGLKRLIKNCIDVYRKWGYKRADALIFENEAMYKRTKQIFGSEKRATYIKPSISLSVNTGNFSFDRIYKDSLVGLFLCGWQLNKNIMCIPSLISEAEKLGKHFEIIITVNESDESSIARAFKMKLEELNVKKSVHMVGRVERKNLSALYEKIDFVFLLSRLESFSNNIIEAWYYQKPLVISDEEWAQGICKNAAIYVNRDNPADIAKSIIESIENNIVKGIIQKGIEEYKTYPSIQERTRQEISYVKDIYETTQV